MKSYDIATRQGYVQRYGGQFNNIDPRNQQVNQPDRNGTVDIVAIGSRPSTPSNYKNIEDESVKILNYTLDQIRIGNEQITGNDKEVVLVCGDTGAGKSTLVNYLIGNELIATNQANSRKLRIECPNSLNSVQIGHGTVSETFIPQRVAHPNSSTVYWDCPGFEDTRGPAIDIANAFYINKLFKTAEKMKIMVVIEEAALDSPRRGQAFKELIGRLGDMFTDKQSLVSSMTLVFTKVRDTDDFRKALTDIVKDDPNLSNHHRDLLNLVIERARIATFSAPSKAEVIKAEERGQILEAMMSSQYTHNPEVNISVSKDSLLTLQKLTEVINKQVKSNTKEIAQQLMIGIDKVPLNNLQEIRKNIEELNTQNFESDNKIVGFIEQHIVSLILASTPNVNQATVKSLMQEIKSKVSYFEDFFCKILPQAQVDSDKLKGTFIVSSLFVVNQAIANEIHKDDQKKLNEALANIETTKQTFTTQLNNQAAQAALEAKKNQTQIEALTKQLNLQTEQRINQDKLIEDFKTQIGGLKTAMETNQKKTRNQALLAQEIRNSIEIHKSAFEHRKTLEFSRASVSALQEAGQRIIESQSEVCKKIASIGNDSQVKDIMETFATLGNLYNIRQFLERGIPEYSYTNLNIPQLKNIEQSLLTTNNILYQKIADL